VNAPNFEQLERAFDEVALLDPPSRAAYLVELRRDTPGIADQLEAMLGADVSGVDSQLREATAFASASEAFEAAGDSQATDAPGSLHGNATLGKAPAQIGRYRVLGEIGEGGFGVVYLAEQPAPAHRLVAIKVIKPGMDTRAVLSRFGYESQALALMDHQSVVAALDAGMTERGHPFIVMPLVAGLAITAFAREQQIGVRERVELMVEVCRGVQHAHSRGVLHRDLKPGNILVAKVEGAAQVKIIDFGLAKAMANPLTPHTTVTLEGQLVGTPEYMSPEQALEKPVDVRSDVYSLGAILYELVAGRAPFTPDELRSGNRDSLRDIVAYRVPAAPSRYALGLARELDWICLRCLKKNPALRYPTAESLAEDLTRFLEGGSVRAGPPAKVYRAITWLRRHKMLAISITAIGMSLVGATGFSMYAAARERDAAAKERAAREDAEQSFAILENALTRLDPVKAQGYDRTLLVMVLDEAAAEFAMKKRPPETEAKFAGLLGSTYYTIGEFTKAYPFLARALELNRALYGRTDPRSVEAFRAFVEVEDRAVIKRHGAWMIPLCTELDQLARAAYQPGTREWIVGRMTALRSSALKYREVSRQFRDLIAESERSLGPNDRVTIQVMRRAAKHADGEGDDKEKMDEWKWGLDVVSEARRRAVETYGEDDADAHAGIALESQFVQRVKGDAAAIELLRERIEPAEQVLGPLAQPVFVAKYNLGEMLIDAAEYEEAERILLNVHGLAERKHGPSTGFANSVDASLLRLYLRMGKMADADLAEKRLWTDSEKGLTLSAALWIDIILQLDSLGQAEKVQRYLEHIRKQQPEVAAMAEEELKQRHRK